LGIICPPLIERVIISKNRSGSCLAYGTGSLACLTIDYAPVTKAYLVSFLQKFSCQEMKMDDDSLIIVPQKIEPQGL
jgi:hypothetical protein